MITKTDLLEALLRECDICIHLYGRLPEGGLEYRPSSAQRNTLELLRYLSFCGIGFARAMVEGDWDPYVALGEASQSLAPEEFPGAMEEQKRALRDLFESLDDEQLAQETAQLPWGEVHTLGRALLELPYRCLCGYRMQLFLYAKAAGNHALTTPDCWAGADAEPQP